MPRSLMCCLLMLLPIGGARAQTDTKPLVIQGELTAQDPLDTVRARSRAKVHELQLQAGTLYLLDLTSLDFDCFLRLENAAGQQLGAHDDVSGASTNARLGFAPAQTAKYRLVATSCDEGQTGRYVLHIGTLKKVGPPTEMSGKLTAPAAEGALHNLPLKVDEIWQIELLSKDFKPALKLHCNKKEIAAAGAQLVFGCGVTGEHVLQVHSQEAGQSGAYTFRLQRLERNQPLTLTREDHLAQEAGAHNERGLTHFNAERWTEADTEFQKALALYQQLYPQSSYPKGHAKIASALLNLGASSYEQRAYKQAEPLLLQALAMRRAVLAPKDLAIALSLESLGHLHAAQRDHVRAEPFYQQTLALRREVLGGKHLLVVQSLNHLAELSWAVKAYDRAEPLYRQLLEIRQEALGARNPALLASISRLTELYRIQEAYAKAQPLHEQRLAILRELHGPKHREVALGLHALAVNHTSQGAYAKAAPLYQEAQALLRATGSTKDLQLAQVLFNQASNTILLSGYDRAVPLLEEALSIRRELLGSKHPAVLACLFTLASSVDNQGAYTRAMPLYEQLLALQREVHGEQHADCAKSLYRLADVHAKQGAYARAVELGQQALTLQRALFGEKHVDVANTLSGLARTYQELNAFTKAEQLAEQALAMRRSLHGEKHTDVAASLHNLATLYEVQGAYTRAQSLHEQALAIRREAVGEQHRDYAWSLNSLANCCDAQGASAKAVLLYEQSLTIWRKTLGEKHPDVATVLDNLAKAQRARAAYSEAEALLQKALAMRREVLGDRHPRVASSLDGLASLHEILGDYAKAESLYLQALALRREVLGEKHRQYADSLDSLAALYVVQGAYPKAEPLHQQALALRRDMLGPRHPDVAASLHNLASLYWAQGSYARAEALTQQALELRRAAYGARHPTIATTLNDLASNYLSQGAYARARPLFEEALAIRRALYGAKHPTVSVCLHNLATLHYYQSAFAEAATLYQQALASDRALLGAQHPTCADKLLNLANLCAAQRDYPQAETHCADALAIYRQVFGAKHPKYASALSVRAHLDFLQNRAQEALPHSVQALQIIAADLEASASIQAEQTQAAFLKTRRFYLNRYLTIAAAATVPAADVYAQLLPWKGAITQRQRLTRVARTELDKETTALFTRLDSISQQYATLSSRPFEPKTAAAVRKQLDELLDQRERLEVALAQRTEAFRKLRQAKQLTPAELQKALPPGTLLVDFLVYEKQVTAVTGVEHLVAFVVTPQRIERIELGPSAKIAEAVDRFRNTLKRTAPVMGKDDPAVFLREKLLEPLDKHLAGAKLVLLAPDGALCRLPFAALPGKKKDSYLLEEMALAVLPVPQMLPELLAPRKERPADVLPSMLALGDVDFDAVPGLPPKTPTTEPSWKRRRAGEALNWPRLPGTKGELLALEDAFKKAVPMGKLHILREADALEAELRKQAPQFEYLHLATHGFFSPKELKSALQGGGRPGETEPRGEQPRFLGHHPGLLSGLVLAGANKPREDDDGVLTALEVAELDLTKIELAVLSACETGLGETAGGEGVLGLQRAFQIAGARSTVTSLWKVDDEATRALMEKLYEGYWTKNLGALEALRAAQLWMLSEGAARGVERLPTTTGPRRLPPYYWAAFVLAGDWR